MLDEKEIRKNYDRFKEYITSYISNPRKDTLLKVFEKYEERFILCPASTNTGYHGAYPGGLVNHTNNVIETALSLHHVWQEHGFTPDYEVEELIFAAAVHDFGKIGDEETPYYIKETSDWHKKTYGRVYKMNPEISFMKVPDRTLYLLNKERIPYTKKEFYAIKLAHGLFDKTNETYLVHFSKDVSLQTAIHTILNQADTISMTIESQLDQDKNKLKENLEGKKWGRPKRTEKLEQNTPKKQANNDTSKGELFGDKFSDLFPSDESSDDLF